MATYYGTTGNNTLNGTESSDTFYGYAGTDYLYGYGGNDFLYGGDNTDYLFGLAGNDWLDGGLGADVMRGGINNDVYIVDTNSDQVIEAVNEGLDRVQAAISYTLTANVENLTLTGSAAINGTGNTLANTMVGNTAANTILGMDGNDSLSGGGGNDTLTGGLGNDYIDGGVGTDTMRGGLNDDTFVVDTLGDITIENANEGTDRINSSITYTLKSNFEHLTLTGSAWINGTGNGAGNNMLGNSGNNTLNGLGGHDSLFGGAGNDTLIGDDGNDALDGGTGADALRGGAGDDAYVIDNTSDTVTEATGQGMDRVTTSVSYTLAANLENITIAGSFGVNATGNSLNNVMTGSSGNNIISGMAGNDVITGGTGIDSLYGGSGSDRFVYLSIADSSTTVRDAIFDFARGADKIDMTALQKTSASEYVAPPEQFLWNETEGLAYGMWYARGATSTYVYADTNGDTQAEMTIELKNTATQQFNATDFIGVTDSTPPEFTSSAYAYLRERETGVAIVSASDPDARPLTYSIVGGADAALFQFDAVSRSLSFVTKPVFATPGDADKDNRYEVNIQATDGIGGTTVQNFIASVYDVNEVYGTEGADSLIGKRVEYYYTEDYEDDIHGYGGDDYINGQGRTDHLYGGAGNDTIYGGYGTSYRSYSPDRPNKLYGEDGNDILWSGDGYGNTLDGGTGNDILHTESSGNRMTGGVGNDVFDINYDANNEGYYFSFTANQTITDFAATSVSASAGDVLNLRDLLPYTSTGMVSDYVQITNSGSDTIVSVLNPYRDYPDHGGPDFVQIATLVGVQTDLNTMVNNGNIDIWNNP